MNQPTVQNEEHCRDEAPRRAQEIEVTVNYKPVKFKKRATNGLEIKDTAIAQGVGIELDFVLFLKVGPRKRKVIGDTDPIRLRDGQKFEAIPHDDNS